MVDKLPPIGFKLALRVYSNSVNIALTRRGGDADKSYLKDRELPALGIRLTVSGTVLNSNPRQEVYQHLININRTTL